MGAALGGSTWPWPLVAHKLQERGPQELQPVVSQARMLCSVWSVPRPGVEHVSPALALGLSSTVQPGRSWLVSFFFSLKKV